MTSPNDLIRRAVGRALWSSKHPKAHSLLLSMWRDPDWGTRDNIVQFLESNPSEEGTRILLELSRDPDEIVRKSAQLALEQLKSRPRP
jgi:HEAT repeat protein